MLGLLLLLNACANNKGTGQHSDSTTRSFGDSIPISNGLLGRVYLLPDTTHWLPDFDTLTPVDNPIYANEINIPWQKWSAGFPGLRDRVEFFGIEYTGSFQPVKANKYIFRLISDDGSKMYIDGKKVIDNDGIHAEWGVRDTIYLSNEPHTIKIDYFQGPRYELALQLFWNQPDSLPKIFPGKEFILYPPPPPSHWWIWLLAALALVVIIFLLRKKARPRTSIVVPFLILQCAALPAKSQFLKNVLNSVKQTATNRANNKAAQVTNSTADKVESVGTSKPGTSPAGSTPSGATTPAAGNTTQSAQPATGASSTSAPSSGGTSGSAATNPPDHDSDSSFLSLSLSATRIITGSLVTISGRSIKYGNMKDVQMTIKGNAGTETKTIPLTDTGHFKTTWGTGMAGEYQITILSSNRKSSKTATVKVFRLMSMDSVVQKNIDDTKEAYDQLKQWIDQVKSKLGPTDATALEKKFDDLTDKKDKVIQLFGDLANLGKGLDKLQQAAGGLGGGGSTGGTTGGGASQTGNLSPDLQSDLTNITDGLSDQSAQMETLNKAAAHKPYDNTICEYIQMVSEACAAFSTFTNLVNPKGFLMVGAKDIAKNVALDKGVPLAVGAAAPNASGLGPDSYKEVAKMATTLADDGEALSYTISKAGLAGDIIQICSNYIMSKYCGVMSGDMSQDYKCTFRNADNAKWWEYTYHNEATVNLRYLKSAATSSLIKMKGNIEGNATKFTIFQKVSEIDDYKKAMKNRAQIFSVCLWVPPTMPAATSQADRQTGFGAVARAIVTPAYFNIPIDADYNPETGQMKIYVNEPIVDYSSEVEYQYGYIIIAAMIPLVTKVHFPINKAKLTIAKVIEKNNDFQVKADANGKLSFNKTAQWTNGPEGAIVHIINITMSAKSN
jgi:PA14 domain